ncbi:iron uptake transporter deferrochelatase/peroxidase subunit [Stenotrophomonas sp.]|uniref:iron uptake transporter deferrochelatase/peroxidase subunit n=1 Tax=Stenotrophomonas sp. TaxID=69392 RepID=UPI002D48F9EE|nr:iron uptake transporter deferrochelatase/peroxidase subunit [Stenotrophomonas sp.]HYQ22737.1 iron uptake transporter deferrochelatase/peroxidase subunit [Stenotrophomonas sp.]
MSRTPSQPPQSPSRRRLLGGLGVAGAALAASPLAAAATRAGAAPDADTGHVTDAPLSAHSDQHVAWLGQHQAGITTPRPASGLLASFYVLAEDRPALERLFRLLTDRIAFLTEGGDEPVLDPKLPPASSGLLGPHISPDALTITVSLGESLFDDRFGLAALKPLHLQQMRAHPNDALDASLCHGDLSIQFCANTPDTHLNALRDIIKNTPDLLSLAWKQEGTVPPVPAVRGQPPQSARNFLGFRDGSANPDAADARQMDTLVWVGAERGEPTWAVGGSYQAVRIIRNFVERWDRTPLQEQEAIMGRRKADGAPLDGGRDEHAVPDFSRDPHGQRTPMDAHIRLANPRTADTARNLILRRPFNYSNGVTRSGQLDMGLLFICYQADLEQGFLAVQRRLDGEPLEEYIKPVGGGFFYTLPGVRDRGDWLGSALLQAADAVAPAPTQPASDQGPSA